MVPYLHNVGGTAKQVIRKSVHQNACSQLERGAGPAPTGPRAEAQLFWKHSVAAQQALLHLRSWVEPAYPGALHPGCMFLESP